MTYKVFENILKSPEKMAQYKKDPVLEATFMAFYSYKKAGHSFDELPWFVLSKLKHRSAQIAA